MDNNFSQMITNNQDLNRFELIVDGFLARIDYQRSGSRIIFTHTIVPPELEGRGIGSQLARFALDSARENKLQVVPHCQFVQSYIKRHPEYQDLVA